MRLCQTPPLGARIRRALPLACAAGDQRPVPLLTPGPTPRGVGDAGDAVAAGGYGELVGAALVGQADPGTVAAYHVAGDGDIDPDGVPYDTQRTLLPVGATATSKALPVTIQRVAAAATTG